MSDKWSKPKGTKNIRYKEHPTRKHGAVGPDKYYVLRFTVDGKKVQEKLGWASDGMTLEKAQFALAKLREAHLTGEGPASLRETRQLATARREAEERRQQEETKAAITLAAYYESTYKPWALSTKLAAFRQEDSHWRTWLSPALGNLPMRDITLDRWDRLVQTLNVAGLSERTRQYVTGTLRRIINHAIERRVVSDAPPSGKVIGATAPKNNRRMRVLEKDELEALLSELKMRDIYVWRATLFAALSGCRLGELTALTWRDVRVTSVKVV